MEENTKNVVTQLLENQGMKHKSKLEIQKINLWASVMEIDLQYYINANKKNERRLENAINDGNGGERLMYEALVRWLKVKIIIIRNIRANKSKEVIKNNLDLLEVYARQVVEYCFDIGDQLEDSQYKELMEGPMKDVATLTRWTAMTREAIDAGTVWSKVLTIKQLLMKNGFSEDKAESLSEFIIDGEFEFDNNQTVDFIDNGPNAEDVIISSNSPHRGFDRAAKRQRVGNPRTR